MDWYYEQLETARPVTEESLNEMARKEFSSGRPIAVGDIIFYGYYQSILITFHKDEINQKYKIDDSPEDYWRIAIFPILKPIT